MVELSFGLLVLLGCVIALKPIVLKTDRPNFRYIPVATLLFGAMIFSVSHWSRRKDGHCIRRGEYRLFYCLFRCLYVCTHANELIVARFRI